MKTRLDPDHYETLLASIEHLHACPSLDAFPQAVLAEVRHLVASDSASYNEFHPAQNRAIALLEPAPPDFDALLARWQECFHENPILRYARETGDGTAHQISDFLTPAEFQRLRLYTEVFEPLQVEHQIAFLLGEPGRIEVGVALNRRQAPGPAVSASAPIHDFKMAFVSNSYSRLPTAHGQPRQPS